MPRSVPPLETKTDGAPQIYYLRLQKFQSCKSLVGCWFVCKLGHGRMAHRTDTLLAGLATPCKSYKAEKVWLVVGL